MRGKCFLGCGCLVLISAAMVWAQPFPDHQQNRWAYETLVELMIMAGMPDSALADFRGRRELTRLEFAMIVNSVMIRLEEQGLELPPEAMAKVERLSTEFQREFLMLQLQEEIRQNRSRLERLLADGTGKNYELGGDFSLLAEKLDGRLPVSQEEQEFFGSAPKHTKVLLAQQLRIRCRAEVNPELGGVLEMRNFGYWGVGRYTSGSTDMNFSSADPLKIDQAFIFWHRSGLRAALGRRNLCYGPWGLLVDRKYEPINAMEITWSRRAQIHILMASQISGIDYLAGRFQIEGLGARVGVTAFYTLFSRKEQEESNLLNEQGGGIDIVLDGQRNVWRLEYALYKPARTANIFQGYVPGLLTEWQFSYLKFLKTRVGLGSLSERFLVKSIPLDLMPLEFPRDGDAIFIPGTWGGYLAEEMRLSRLAMIRADWITMIRHNGSFYMNWIRGWMDLSLYRRINLVIENSYRYGRQQRYNQIGAMLKINF